MGTRYFYAKHHSRCNLSTGLMRPCEILLVPSYENRRPGGGYGTVIVDSRNMSSMAFPGLAQDQNILRDTSIRRGLGLAN